MKKIFAIILFSFIQVFPQYNGYNFGITANYVYTTSSKIYLHPNSTDPVIRNSNFTIDGLTNPSLDIRYRISDQIIGGLSIEYIKAKTSGPNLTGYSGLNTVEIITEDGFEAIPVELSIYYYLPFSTESFKFVFGGGGGYYYGSYIRKFGNAEAKTIERQAAFGMQVAFSMDYLVIKNLSLRLEMKFRDPQFNLTNKYDKTTVKYKNMNVLIPQDIFKSKVNIDGVTFLLGLGYYFSL